MLPELYRYALRHELTARAGYKERKVKAYVNFFSSGGIPSLIPSPWVATYAPDLGSKANGTTKCNPLVEKANYVLNLFDPDDPKTKNNTVKYQFYLSMLQSAAAYEPRLALCHGMLADEAALGSLREALAAAKLHGGDPIGLMVDGFPLERSEELYPWWESFRADLDDKPRAAMRCLITGDPAEPVPTVPKVTGLRSVGGHTSGDALLCFDKDAFTSYGFAQGENACVSEEAITAVNAALGRLIAKSPRLAGARYVYFYKEPVLPAEDPMPLVFGEFLTGDTPAEADPEASAEGGEADEAGEALGPDQETQEAADAVDAAEPAEDGVAADERRLAEAAAEQAAKALVKSIQEGRRPDLLQNRYYIMPLSGASGRVMVRGWMEGDFADLCQNIQQWFEDLQLTTPYGQGVTRAPKLFGLCTRLLKPQKGGKKIGARIDDELSAIVPRILYAILHNTALPDTVASRALAHIRSGLLASVEEDATRERILDPLACQLLKAWLNRSIRAKGGTILMDKELNPSYQGIAYQLGRLMAVYANLQTDALGSDLGAGVLQRYYASASMSPALVIGKLAQLSQYHLSKLSNAGATGKAVYYSKLLQEIYVPIQQAIPTTLSLMQQSEFALGYYHQRAALFAPKPGKDDDETQNAKDAADDPANP